MIYLTSLALIIILLGFTPPQYGLQRNNHKMYLIICGFLIAFFSGFRSPYVGSGDTYQYMRFFQNLKAYNNFMTHYDLHLSDYDFLSSEAGFDFLIWFLGRFFNNGQVVIVFTSTYIAWATCRFIHKNSVDPPLSLTIYMCLTMFTFNMNGMRQAMAMSTCLLAFEFAKSRKLIPFVLTVCMAMLFHKTAMCFFPVWFLPIMKNKTGSWLFYVFGLAVCLLFVNEVIDGYYQLTGSDYSDNGTATGGGVLVILLYAGAVVLAIYRKNLLEKSSARTALLGTLAGLTAYVARYVGSDILERVSYYYYYFLILLIPEVFNELKENEYKVIKTFFIIGALALFVYRVKNWWFAFCF